MPTGSLVYTSTATTNKHADVCIFCHFCAPAATYKLYVLATFAELQVRPWLLVGGNTIYWAKTTAVGSLMSRQTSGSHCLPRALFLFEGGLAILSWSTACGSSGHQNS